MAQRRGRAGSALPEKTCATCGRRFSWRKKWARDWATVRYCSKRCRSERSGAEARALEESVLAVLSQSPGRTWIPLTPLAFGLSVPSEVLRQAARRLAVRRELELGMGGRVVDPTAARGAVQVRLCATTSRDR